MEKQKTGRNPYANPRVEWLRQRGFKTLRLTEQLFNSPRLWGAVFLVLLRFAALRHVDEAASTQP